MTQPYKDARRFLAALAAMAEELRQALVPMSEGERSALVTSIVADSAMVFGVWPDSDAEDGVGIQVIKGAEIMPPLVGFETGEDIDIAAIPCAGREQAVAAREFWGERCALEQGVQTGNSAKSKLSATELARFEWASARYER